MSDNDWTGINVSSSSKDEMETCLQVHLQVSEIELGAYRVGQDWIVYVNLDSGCVLRRRVKTRPILADMRQSFFP